MSQVEVKRRQIQLMSHMLGLISIWILGKKIGDNGVAYLATALEGFYIVWCITGANVSDTLGRLLRSRNAKGQYKNTAKMRKNILFLQCFTGIAGSVLFGCLSSLLAEKIFRMPHSRLLLLLLAPVILIRTISAVLLGYFQGDGAELPTAITAVLRQVLFLILGILFCNIVGGYGEKVSALLGQEAFSSMYGGIGIVVAVLITELLITLLLFLVYKGSSHSKSKKESEGMKATDSFGGHVSMLFRNMSGKTLLGLLESLPLWMGVILFQKSVPDVYASASHYGIYFGKYLTLIGVAILIIAVSVTAVNARVVSFVRKEEPRHAKSTFQSGLRIVMIHALFGAVFIAIMAKQIAGIVGGSGEAALTTMLSHGSLLIGFVTLAFFFSRLLLLLGKEFLVYGCAGIGDIAFISSLVILLKNGGIGIMSLVYAGMIGAGLYAALAGVLMFRQLRTGMDVLRTLAIPAGSACLMGLLCFFLSKIFTPHLGNLVTIVVCLVLGGMLYWGLILFLRCFREQDLNAIPGGRVMRAIGQLLRVF